MDDCNYKWKDGWQLDVPEDGPELASQAGLHQHVEVLPVLEGLEQLHDKLGV